MKHDYVIIDNKYNKSIKHSKVVRVGKLLLISGEIPLDSQTGELEFNDFEKAAKLCIQNLFSDVKSEGTNIENIVSTTIYLKDKTYINTLNEVYDFYFNGNPPVKKIVEGKSKTNLPLEIDALAIVR
jgi:Putative translation initiation inhibitor, yjgF family